jgi:hypothetical protein
VILGVPLSPYTIGTHYNLCPSATGCAIQWKSTVGGAGQMYVDYDRQKWKVRQEHAQFKNGHDRRSAGADFDQVPLIRDLDIKTTATKALITYRVSPVNRHIPCVVEVSTAPDIDWKGEAGSFPADLNAATYDRPDSDAHDAHMWDDTRRMVLLGKNASLTAGEEYYFRLHCGGDMRERWGYGANESTSFTTRASVSGTNTLGYKFAAPADGNYRLEYGTYSRSADTLSDATGYTACTTGANCGLETTINKDDIVIYRWERQSDGVKGPLQVMVGSRI